MTMVDMRSSIPMETSLEKPDAVLQEEKKVMKSNGDEDGILLGTTKVFYIF